MTSRPLAMTTRGMVVLFMRPGTEKDKAQGMAVFRKHIYKHGCIHLSNKHFKHLAQRS